jgi:hypothetical protein
MTHRSRSARRGWRGLGLLLAGATGAGTRGGVGRPMQAGLARKRRSALQGVAAAAAGRQGRAPSRRRRRQAIARRPSATPLRHATASSAAEVIPAVRAAGAYICLQTGLAAANPPQSQSKILAHAGAQGLDQSRGSRHEMGAVPFLTWQ